MNASQLGAALGLGPVLPLISFGNVLLFLFNIVHATAIVLLNACVFVAVLTNRNLRGENRFMYMLSTSLSDTCTGVSYYYCGVLDVRDYFDSPTRTYFIVYTFLGLSFMAILAAQADRYHCITAPFKYSQRVSRSRTLMVIGSYWLYAFVIVAVHNCAPLSVSKKVTLIGTLKANVVAVVIVIVLNIKLFIVAQYQLARECPGVERESKRASVHLIIVVAVCFLAMWLPFFMFVSVCNFVGTPCYLFRNDGTDPVRILARLSAVFTPLIYIILRTISQSLNLYGIRL